MLIGMIKTKNDDEVVTKGWFREAMKEAIDEFAIIVNKGFVGMESRMAKQEDLLALTARVDRFESRFDKFEKNTDGNFDKVFLELKEIRKQINNNEVDTRDDVVDIQARLTKLEKKTS
jgi:hypothetical protein